MNRKQRRQALKNGLPPASIAKRQREDIAKETIDFAFDGMAAAMMLVLHDKFGFGEQRLHKALKYFNETFDSIVDGRLSLDDVLDTVSNDFKIQIRR